MCEQFSSWQHMLTNNAYTCMYVFSVVFAAFYVADWSGQLCLFRHFQTHVQASCGNMMKCRLAGAIVALPEFPNEAPGIVWQHDEVPAFQHMSSHDYPHDYTCMYVFRVVCAGFYVADWSGPVCLFRHFQTHVQESGGHVSQC